jgi:hypothetical protein
MRWRTLALVLSIAAAFAGPASAGIFFNRHPKPNPAERVPQLIAALKTETDDRKREAAVKELRDYDAATQPDVIPTLIDVLQHDPKAAVRSEAAETLGKLRPVSQQVGQALEQAAGNDASVRVRLQCRTTLMSYRLAGYSSRKKVEEKPVAAVPPPPVPVTAAPKKQTVVPIVPNTRRGPLMPAETLPPPLAEPVAEMPQLKPVPGKAKPGRADEGPELGPPE